METKLRILIQDKNSGSPFFQKMLLKFVKRSTLNMVQDETDIVDGNKIIIIFYFIYCVCANYKCCIMPSRGPDLDK
jgi:hypothetical protein